MTEVAFQDKTAVKKMNQAIMYDKVMSSYPTIQDILAEADRVCLDSPWKFAALCTTAGKRISQIIAQLESDVNTFNSNRKDILKQKGWWDSDV